MVETGDDSTLPLLPYRMDKVELNGVLGSSALPRYHAVMPLTQPERDNPRMRRYFRQINMPGKQLAKKCGVSHSQIHMARKRNVGADNAEKISRGMAMILGLSYEERLRLKAEIMGHPENIVRAYLGDG